MSATPDRIPGQDEMWDRLGDDWRAVDNIRPGMPRVYVRWGIGDDGRPKVSGLCIADGVITADTLRAIPISRLENQRALDGTTVSRGSLDDLPPLVRRQGGDPEEFSGRVAHYYRIAAATTGKPSMIIARHSGVPATTVRGWIREARLRGKLPAGIKGRAG